MYLKNFIITYLYYQAKSVGSINLYSRKDRNVEKLQVTRALTLIGALLMCTKSHSTVMRPLSN